MKLVLRQVFFGTCKITQANKDFTTDVHNWCSGNFSKIELSTSLDSLKNSASFDIWLD